MSHKLISVVVPAYNEEGGIEELARQLAAVFDQNSAYDFEAIIVENGSTDGTFEKLLDIRRRDARFKIVRLSRNFRMDGGITAGLDYVTGDALVIMTANLQDTPDTITRMIAKWQEGYENVYCIVKKRTGKGLFRRLCSQLFYILLTRLTGNIIPRNVSDFRLVDRKVYTTIRNMKERTRFMRGMFAWAGFKSIGIEMERGKRFAGESHAHFRHVLQLAIRGIFAFSYVPIKFIAAFGFIMAGCSFFYLLIEVALILTRGVPTAGWGTIVSLILLMFGMLFFCMGVLGQYISQIYEEVKGRPNFIVSDTFGFEPPAQDPGTPASPPSRPQA